MIVRDKIKGRKSKAFFYLVEVSGTIPAADEIAFKLDFQVFTGFWQVVVISSFFGWFVIIVGQSFRNLAAVR